MIALVHWVISCLGTVVCRCLKPILSTSKLRDALCERLRVHDHVSGLSS